MSDLYVVSQPTQCPDASHQDIGAGQGGSPPLHPTTKTVRVEIRVTPAERRAWKTMARAAGRTLSDLVREAVGRVRVWRPDDRASYQARTREIARIGNNLNQIARAANQKNALDTIAIIAELESISRAIARLGGRDAH